MTTPGVDPRTPERRALDEQIAAEPQLPWLDLPLDAPTSSLEAHLERRRVQHVGGSGGERDTDENRRDSKPPDANGC